jgi:hypothetical protein
MPAKAPAGTATGGPLRQSHDQVLHRFRLGWPDGEERSSLTYGERNSWCDLVASTGEQRSRISFPLEVCQHPGVAARGSGVRAHEPQASTQPLRFRLPRAENRPAE